MKEYTEAIKDMAAYLMGVAHGADQEIMDAIKKGEDPYFDCWSWGNVDDSMVHAQKVSATREAMDAMELLNKHAVAIKAANETL